MALTQNAQRGQAIHVRQVVVQQHQVKVVMGVSLCKSACAGGCIQHFHGLVQAFEDLAQPLSDQCVVVNDQYLHSV